MRDTLDLHEGDPYSVSELDDARTALLNLGVFSSVQISEDRTHPESGRVPLKRRCAKATSAPYAWAEAPS